MSKLTDTATLRPVTCTQVRLSLLETGVPLSAGGSALAVVKFVHDRHRYSGEQLANVLTADGFLCYRDEDNRVRQTLRAAVLRRGVGL